MKATGLERDRDAAALNADNLAPRQMRKRVLRLFCDVEIAEHRIADQERN